MKLSHQEIIDRSRLSFMSYRDYSKLAARHDHIPIDAKMYANQVAAVEAVARKPEAPNTKKAKTTDVFEESTIVKRPKKFAPGSNPSLFELAKSLEAQEREKAEAFFRASIAARNKHKDTKIPIPDRWPFPLGAKPERPVWPFRKTVEEEQADKANAQFKQDIEKMIFDTYNINGVLSTTPAKPRLKK